MRTAFRLAIFSFLASNCFGQELPNHLEPIKPAIWSAGLGQAVDGLVPPGDQAVWMIVSPSLQKGWAVSIIRSQVVGQKPTYCAWLVESRDPVLVPPPPPPGNKKSNGKFLIPTPRPLHKFSAPLVPEMAERIISAWRECVKGTRYSGDLASHGGFDGISYFFYAERNFYGKTWGPQAPTPTALVNVAQSLAEYAQSNITARSVALGKVSSNLKELETSLH